eukprot:54178-Rhodomonas_salina.3
MSASRKRSESKPIQKTTRTLVGPVPVGLRTGRTIRALGTTHRIAPRRTYAHPRRTTRSQYRKDSTRPQYHASHSTRVGAYPEALRRL